MLLLEPTKMSLSSGGRWIPGKRHLLRWLLPVALSVMTSATICAQDDETSQEKPKEIHHIEPDTRPETFDLDHIERTLSEIDSSLDQIQKNIEVVPPADYPEPELGLNFVYSGDYRFGASPTAPAGLEERVISIDMGAIDAEYTQRAATPHSQMEADHWDLFKAAVVEYNTRRESTHPQRFDDELQQGIDRKVEGKGEYKITLVAGVVGVRTLVNDSSLAVLHVNVEDILSQKVKEEQTKTIAAKLFGVATPEYHFASVVSRQLMVSHRDLLVANRRFDGASSLSSYDYYRRPAALTREWLEFHWKSVRAKPNNGDLVFGPMFATAQWGGVVCLTGLGIYLNGGDLDLSLLSTSYVAQWTFAFGTVVGIWSTTYRNLILAGKTQMDRIGRSLISSVAFTAGVAVAKYFESPESYDQVTITTAFLGMWAYVFNIGFNQYTKDEYSTPVRADTILRRNTGMQKLFGVEYKIANMQSNMINLRTMLFKMGDLLKIKVDSIPVGRYLYYSIIIPHRYFMMKRMQVIHDEAYAELLKNPNDSQLRYTLSRVRTLLHETKKKWFQVVNVFYRTPVRLVTKPADSTFRQRVVRNVVKKTSEIVQSFRNCAQAVSGVRPTASQIDELFPSARVNHRNAER